MTDGIQQNHCERTGYTFTRSVMALSKWQALAFALFIQTLTLFPTLTLPCLSAHSMMLFYVTVWLEMALNSLLRWMISSDGAHPKKRKTMQRSLLLICLLNYTPMIKQFSSFYLTCRRVPSNDALQIGRLLQKFSGLPFSFTFSCFSPLSSTSLGWHKRHRVLRFIHFTCGVKCRISVTQSRQQPLCTVFEKHYHLKH